MGLAANLDTLKVKLERFVLQEPSYLDMLKVNLERFSVIPGHVKVKLVQVLGVKPGYVKGKAGYVLAKQLKKQTWELFGW